MEPLGVVLRERYALIYDSRYIQCHLNYLQLCSKQYYFEGVCLVWVSMVVFITLA